MKNFFAFRWIIFSLIAGVLVGCRATSPSPAEQTQAALFAQATLAEIVRQTQQVTFPPTPTEQSLPTITPSLTSTQTQAISPPPTAEEEVGERIAFAANATQYHAEGITSLRKSKVYLIYALKDQLLDISVTSSDEVGISIVGADGTVLVSPMGESTSFRGALPSSQDYTLTVRTTASSATFNLSVMIPARIAFGAGENSTQVKAPALSGGYSRQYSLYALSGQTLSVTVVPADDFALTIYGADGTVLMGSHNYGNTFSGILPSTQYYIISVSAAPGVTTSYTLTVSVP